MVYCVPCVDCDDVYVGQIGRSFQTRLNNHKAAVRLGNVNNACAKHSRDLHHNIDWNCAGPIFKSNLLNNRLIVESTLIKTRPNFNNMPGSLTIENLAAKTILRSNRYLHPPD